MAILKCRNVKLYAQKIDFNSLIIYWTVNPNKAANYSRTKLEKFVIAYTPYPENYVVQ